jgi:hypothetical protein
VTSAEFCEAGLALYGRAWKRKLAEVLQVDLTTIRRWARGSKPSGPAAVALRLMIENKKREGNQ